MNQSEEKGKLDFDAYHKWLGIPLENRPPTHHQILGLAEDETDEEVIRAAGVRRSSYVRNFQSGHTKN